MNLALLLSGLWQIAFAVLVAIVLTSKWHGEDDYFRAVGSVIVGGTLASAIVALVMGVALS